MNNNKILPEISVVMPVFNSEKYLSIAIESVIEQSFENFEFLIIYDDSYDNSLEILESYAKVEPRIKIVKGNNEGISGALNNGINLSEGKFIARMDADDICEKDRFKEQLNYIKKNDLDICGSHSILINNLGHENGFFIAPITHDSCSLALAFEVPFMHPSVFIRKYFLDKHDLRYRKSEFIKAEDYDLWIRMHEKGAKFGNNDQVLIRYRVLDDSLSRLNNKKVIKDAKLLSNNFFKANYDLNFKNIDSIIEVSNSKERLLVGKFLITNFLKCRYKQIGVIKYLSFKDIIYILISEILKKIRFAIAKLS